MIDVDAIYFGLVLFSFLHKAKTVVDRTKPRSSQTIKSIKRSNSFKFFYKGGKYMNTFPRHQEKFGETPNQNKSQNSSPASTRERQLCKCLNRSVLHITQPDASTRLTLLFLRDACGSVIQAPNLVPDVFTVSGPVIFISLPHAANTQHAAWKEKPGSSAQ